MKYGFHIIVKGWQNKLIFFFSSRKKVSERKRERETNVGLVAICFQTTVSSDRCVGRIRRCCSSGGSIRFFLIYTFVFHVFVCFSWKEKLQVVKEKGSFLKRAKYAETWPNKNFIYTLNPCTGIRHQNPRPLEKVHTLNTLFGHFWITVLRPHLKPETLV